MNYLQFCFLLLALLIFSFNATAQITFQQSVSIDTLGSDPHPHAILDLVSTEKGLMLPRMSSDNRIDIGLPSPTLKDDDRKRNASLEGLVVYDTKVGAIYVYSDGVWSRVLDENGMGVVFNADNGVVSAQDHTDADFIFGRSELPEVGGFVSDKFFFFKNGKAAFRGGGLVQSNHWNPDSIGFHSFGYGLNVKAKGDYSAAFGQNTTSPFDNLFTIGKFNRVPADFEALVTSDPLFVIGNGTSDSDRSNAMLIDADGSWLGEGYALNYFSDFPSLSGGQPVIDTIALMSFQAQFPSSSHPVGALRTGVVYLNLSSPSTSVPPGIGSFSAGINTIAADPGGAVVGMYNEISTDPSTPTISPSTVLFAVGNGDSEISRSNAFVVRKSGEVDFGDITFSDTTISGFPVMRVHGGLVPSNDDDYNLGIASRRWKRVYAANGTINTSDLRAKKNITNLENSLDQIMAIRPVSYHWKEDAIEDKKSLGVIAQELLKVVPEAVEVPEDKEELYGVNYSQLIPVLIKGMQEQQETIEHLAQRLAVFEKLVAEK